jgi:cell division transport system permease protein
MGSLRLHAVSIFSLAVAFVCLASSLLIVTNMSLVRDRWARAGRATIFLRDGASEDDVSAIQKALAATHGVKRVRAVSSIEARREVLANDTDSALAALPTSAFPASLEIGFAEDIDDASLATIAAKLRALPAVESVETYEKWTERLSSLIDGGVAASACLALVVLAAVVSVVGSTMRLLFQRRQIEVEVLKLVGATDAFVRRPFVVEAMAQGALGATAAIGLLGLLFFIVQGRFDHELATLIGMKPSFLPWHIALGMVALGGLLGALTALTSLRKLVRI